MQGDARVVDRDGSVIGLRQPLAAASTTSSRGAPAGGTATALAPGRCSSTTWSAMRSTSASCVASTNVVPRRAASAIASRTRSALSRSSSAVGSSTTTSVAPRASATANAARASSPPESSAARARMRCATPSRSNTAASAPGTCSSIVEMREEVVGRTLRDERDRGSPNLRSAAPRRVAGATPSTLNVPAGRHLLPRQQSQQRGLAAARDADERGDAAGPNLGVHAVERDRHRPRPSCIASDVLDEASGSGNAQRLGDSSRRATSSGDRAEQRRARDEQANARRAASTGRRGAPRRVLRQRIDALDEPRGREQRSGRAERAPGTRRGRRLRAPAKPPAARGECPSGAGRPRQRLQSRDRAYEVEKQRRRRRRAPRRARRRACSRMRAPQSSARRSGGSDRPS